MSLTIELKVYELAVVFCFLKPRANMATKTTINSPRQLSDFDLPFQIAQMYQRFDIELTFVLHAVLSVVPQPAEH